MARPTIVRSEPELEAMTEASLAHGLCLSCCLPQLCACRPAPGCCRGGGGAWGSAAMLLTCLHVVQHPADAAAGSSQGPAAHRDRRCVDEKEVRRGHGRAHHILWCGHILHTSATQLGTLLRIIPTICRGGGAGVAARHPAGDS